MVKMFKLLYSQEMSRIAFLLFNFQYDDDRRSEIHFEEVDHVPVALQKM